MTTTVGGSTGTARRLPTASRRPRRGTAVDQSDELAQAVTRYRELEHDAVLELDRQDGERRRHPPELVAPRGSFAVDPDRGEWEHDARPGPGQPAPQQVAHLGAGPTGVELRPEAPLFAPDHPQGTR